MFAQVVRVLFNCVASYEKYLASVIHEYGAISRPKNLQSRYYIYCSSVCMSLNTTNCFLVITQLDAQILFNVFIYL